jgi:hypothetical protein
MFLVGPSSRAVADHDTRENALPPPFDLTFPKGLADFCHQGKYSLLVPYY